MISTILIALAVTCILVAALWCVHRNLRKHLRQLQNMTARFAHGQAMDLAVWGLRLQQVPAVEMVRSVVDDDAKRQLQGELGPGYEDWLRDLYKRTAAANAERTVSLG